MKIAGFLMLLSGWVLVLAAVVLLPAGGALASFALIGVAVELLALVLIFRSHPTPQRRHE